MATTTPPRRPWFRRINAPLWAALVSTILCALLYTVHRAGILEVPGLTSWEQRSIDIRFQVRGPAPLKDDRVIIVALDNATRQGMPSLWQNRRGFAELIRKISASSPRAFGIDAFFAAPEINLSPRTVTEVRRARAELAAQTEPLSAAAAVASSALEKVDEETRGDALLADAVRDSEPLVLALLFYLGGSPLPPGSPERPGAEHGRIDESVFLDQPIGQRPPRASGAVVPLPAIGEQTKHMGHVNVRHDSDGMVREAPLVIESGGRFYQSLSLKLTSMELGATTSYASGDTFVSLGDRKIPLDTQTFARIAYLGPNKTFPRISAMDVMQSEAPHPALHDKIVLLGYTDSARDKITTPLERRLDGVELHATLIHNMLHGELLRHTGASVTILVILFFGGLLALLQLRSVRKRGVWMLGLGSLVLFISYCVAAQLIFAKSNLVIEVAAPLLSALVITLTALTIALATEGREKAQIRSAFGQYLQSTLVERLIQDPDRLRLGGQRQELTVLFSDIRGFSRFSEQLAPELLSDFLNEYLTPMTELVMEDAGMLDKYIGDAVMAVYGAPLHVEDHAIRACRTALSMQAALAPLNDSWKQKGLPEIRIGIGINTGEMSVGNMGSQRRFDYTVMGDAVNLGARLESLTKSYNVGILVGEETRRLARTHYAFREIDRVRVLGRSAAASVYELTGTASAPGFTDAQQTLFAQGLAAYRDQDWKVCEERLTAFLAEVPGDGPSTTLLERLDDLRSTDLGETWDGVFDQRVK